MGVIYKEYPGFLTKEQCKELINYFTDPNRAAQGKMVLKRAEVDDNVNGGSKQDPSRKAELLFFKRDGAVSKKYGLAKLCNHINSDFGNQAIYNVKNLEGWQFIKYDVGGEYIPHHDFDVDLNNRHNKIRLAISGGLRLKSIIIYLNDDFEGGHTFFKHLDISIKPKTGMMLFFKYDSKYRHQNFRTLHAGLPVESGTKYIISAFIREGSEIDWQPI